MDIREKLVELICDGTQKTEICKTDTYMDCETCRGDCGYCTILADHLIANGVTVQEWVSVDDRLPEPREKTICINRYGDIMIGIYTEWGWMFPCYFEEPTHWMPLPQPPKGE